MEIKTQQPIFIFAKWQAKDGEMQKVLDLLPALVEKSKNEDGNLFYKIYQENSEPNTLVLHECYRDMESVESHKNSEHYREIALKQIIPLLQNREVILASEVSF